jgi:UDP-3-O-[3-hydroxymyristoyl] N-acetylglucosamine deacetylase
VARQQTFVREVTCAGKGLHSGAEVALGLTPGSADTGIVFVRTDLGGAEIPARPSSVVSIYRATTLGVGDASVATVEHLLAALFACGVDNARIEVDGPEVPVLDGSSAPFVSLIREAGLLEQECDRACLRVLRPVEIRDGERSIRAIPCDRFRIDYEIDFEHKLIGRQQIAIDEVSGESFERELAQARTFGLLSEVESLRAAGLGLGGDLSNTVVLGDDAVLNEGGLRWPDEFVRHKALDLIGDLSLLGGALEAEIQVCRGGHALHQRLARELLDSPGAAAWGGSGRTR